MDASDSDVKGEGEVTQTGQDKSVEESVEGEITIKDQSDRNGVTQPTDHGNKQPESKTDNQQEDSKNDNKPEILDINTQPETKTDNQQEATKNDIKPEILDTTTQTDILDTNTLTDILDTNTLTDILDTNMQPTIQDTKTVVETGASGDGQQVNKNGVENETTFDSLPENPKPQTDMEANGFDDRTSLKKEGEEMSEISTIVSEDEKISSEGNNDAGSLQEMDINGNSPLNVEVQTGMTGESSGKVLEDDSVQNSQEGKDLDVKLEDGKDEEVTEGQNELPTDNDVKEKEQRKEDEANKEVNLEEQDTLQNVQEILDSGQDDQIDTKKLEMEKQAVEEVENHESKGSDHGDNEDNGNSTDTSTLANIIVQHVLNTAVSNFQHETSFSSDQEEENDVKIISNSIVDDNRTSGAKAEEPDNLSLQSEENNLESTEYSNDREMSEPPANVVAREIAVSMLANEEEEKNRVTDQIKKDIQEISEHISLNDTAEIEQNNEIPVEHPTTKTHDQAYDKTDRESYRLSPFNNAEGQGQSILEPLPNHPDYPINYGNYKVCRNVSPTEKECLILETGELVTSKDMDEVATNDMSYPQENQNQIYSEHHSLESQRTLEHPPNSIEYTSHSSGREETFSSSVYREKSININPSPRQQPVSENNFYDHVNLQQSVHSEEPSRVSAMHMNQQDNFHHQHNSNIPGSHLVDKENVQPLNFAYVGPNLSSLSKQSDSFAAKNLYQTEGAIDLSDPSVMVRYQRNVLSQSLQKNLANTHIPKDSRESSLNFSAHSADPVPLQQRPGPVPSYKTLHEQQNTWMQMFKTLEEKHQLEMQQQNRVHNEALFNLQQHMEDELFNQQKSFRQKLTMHKEALSQSLNNSLSPGHVHQKQIYSKSNSHILQTTDNLTNSPDQTLSYEETFNTCESFLQRQSPSWRQIYREIRGTEASDDEPSPHESVRRSLDKDFTESPGRLRPNIVESGQKEQYTKTQTLSPRGQPRSGNVEPPRAGVYSSPLPISRGRANDSQAGVQCDQTRAENKSNNTCDNLNSSMEKKQRHPQESQHPVTGSLNDSGTSDDVNLSSSTRFSLREKHAKHMADLREYYEKELRDLRSSLLADMADQSPMRQISSENRNLVIENRLLKEKIEDTEEELAKINRKARELEQKNHGLEVRANEYAEKYSETQAKLSNFRNKMEELQFYFREKDESVQQLEYQVKHLNDKVKNAQKVNQELTSQIQKERVVLQKISEKYDNSEKEHSRTKEALNNTECKLYDAKAEVAELKRTISKLELENKRISRENYNLNHLKFQSSSLQNSFEVAPSDTYSSPIRDRPIRPVTHDDSRPNKDCDNTASSREREDYNSSRDREESFTKRNKDDSQRNQENNRTRREREESLNGSIRSTTPKKNGSHYFSDDSDSNSADVDSKVSPVMRAEQDLYRLRDMMRDITQSPSDPPKLKLKKKFYGSDVQKHNKNYETSPSYINNHKSTKTSPKPKTSRSRSSQESLNGSHRPASKQDIDQRASSSPRRSDVQRNGVSSRRQPDGEADQSRSPRNRSERNNDEKSQRSKQSLKAKVTVDRNGIEDTLSKVNSGEYISRPQWEDVYTSMAEPKEKTKQRPQKDKIKDRLLSITDLEHRYDDLNGEKRRLEAVLSRIPLHGKGRQEKESVEDDLDQIERELGSIRMSLKRYNVLKSTI